MSRDREVVVALIKAGRKDLARRFVQAGLGEVSQISGVVLLNKLSTVAGAARVHAFDSDDLEQYFDGETPGRGWETRQGDFVYDLGQYEISIYTHVDPDPDGGYELETELYDKRIPKTMPNKRDDSWLYHYFGIKRNEDLRRHGSRVVKEAQRMIKQHERKTKAAVIAALLRARRPDLANVAARAPEGAPLKSVVAEVDPVIVNEIGELVQEMFGPLGKAEKLVGKLKGKEQKRLQNAFSKLGSALDAAADEVQKVEELLEMTTDPWDR